MQKENPTYSYSIRREEEEKKITKRKRKSLERLADPGPVSVFNF
jgi:hypothetical protein